MKIIKGLIYVALYYMLLDLFVFYSFVFRAWSKLGYLPYYNHPDPNDLGFYNHYRMVHNCFELIPYCLVIIFLYGIICIMMKKIVFKINKWHFFIFGILIFIEVMTIFSPLFEWFVD